MRTLSFSTAQNNIFIRIVQAINWQGNQGGSYKKQEITVFLQDSLEILGVKAPVEVKNPDGSMGLGETIRLEKDTSCNLKESQFDHLKDLVENFSKAGLIPARDSIAVKNYLDEVPTVKEVEA